MKYFLTHSHDPFISAQNQTAQIFYTSTDAGVVIFFLRVWTFLFH